MTILYASITREVVFVAKSYQAGVRAPPITADRLICANESRCRIVLNVLHFRLQLLTLRASLDGLSKV